jgi:hypothetical protein
MHIFNWLLHRISYNRQYGGIMILRLSQKLAKKIKESPGKNLPESVNPYADWSADLFYVHRDQYIIFTNSKTLFSGIMHGSGVPNFDRFMENFSFIIRELVDIAGQTSFYERYMLPVYDGISISRRSNRRVIGSMNDIIRCAKVVLDEGLISPIDASIRMNDMPMSMLGYDCPEDAFMSIKRIK